MRLIYLIILVLYFPIHDLLSSWLFGKGIVTDVVVLRYLRDFSVASLALYALSQFRTPVRLKNTLWLYGGFVAVYGLFGFFGDLDMTVVTASIGTLLIPVLLFLVGHHCLVSSNDYWLVARLLLLLGCCTAVFGMYDMQNTDFWLDTVHYDLYQRYVKMAEIGLSPETGLPWNFFGGVYDDSRRAAGLFAAPLAQGHFLAVTLAIAIALYSLDRNPGYIAAFALMLIGIWQSGTRGGMLVAFLAVVGLLLSSPVISNRRAIRLISAVAAAAGILFFLRPTIELAANLTDSSSYGHWAAFTRNIEDLPHVLIVGEGIGTQGAFAASQLDMQGALAGGGEGALFTIAFQMGVPAALIFLILLWQCHRSFSHCGSQDPATRSIAHLMQWLVVGFATSLVLSETLLAFSGSAAFWVLLGGAVRLTMPTPGPAGVPTGEQGRKLASPDSPDRRRIGQT